MFQVLRLLPALLHLGTGGGAPLSFLPEPKLGNKKKITINYDQGKENIAESQTKPP